MTPSPTLMRRRTAHRAAKKSVRIEVGQRRGATGAAADGARESEGCKVARTSGNGLAPDPAERRRPVSM